MASLPHRSWRGKSKNQPPTIPETSPPPRPPSPQQPASSSQAEPKEKASEKPPANVTPIGPIGSIPPISPSRPPLPPFVGSFLMGKTVDESGDIIDPKTGQVLAHAAGDLPSMVGRPVSNRQGDILGDDGELLGYVADVEIERKSSQGKGMGKPRNLFEVMGRSHSSLMVDDDGNILDAEGNAVGKFHDNNNPLHRARRESTGGVTSPPSGIPDIASPGGEDRRPPRRTEEERQQNAEAWRKEKPGESPSDIFLDVKSTTEGIQLTIRIPTVFGGQQIKPNISFS